MPNIRVGDPDVDPAKPSHTKGVREGNKEGAYEKQVGHHKDGTADARRSTGIRPKHRNPILPSMPKLTPP